MSRVGKRPVPIPSGVTASVEGQTVKMKGPKGQLQFVVHNDVEVKFEDGAVKVAPRIEPTGRRLCMAPRARRSPIWSRASPRVSRRSSRSPGRLPCCAAGQEPAARARLQPRCVYAIRKASPSWCRSRPRSRSRALIPARRQVAAEIRAYRPPEPYKGKGVKYPTNSSPQGSRRSNGAVMSLKVTNARRKQRVRTRCAGPPMDVRVCRCSVRRSTSTPRSSTT